MRVRVLGLGFDLGIVSASTLQLSWGVSRK